MSLICTEMSTSFKKILVKVGKIERETQQRSDVFHRRCTRRCPKAKKALNFKKNMSVPGCEEAHTWLKKSTFRQKQIFFLWGRIHNSSPFGTKLECCVQKLESLQSSTQGTELEFYRGIAKNCAAVAVHTEKNLTTKSRRKNLTTNSRLRFGLHENAVFTSRRVPHLPAIITKALI